MNLTQFAIHLGTDGQIAVAVCFAAMIGSLFMLVTERSGWQKDRQYQRKQFAPVKPVLLTKDAFKNLED